MSDYMMKMYNNILNFLDTLKAIIFDMIDENRITKKQLSDIMRHLNAIKDALSNEKIELDSLKKSLLSLANIAKLYMNIMSKEDLEELPNFPIREDSKVVNVINSIDEIIRSDLGELFKNTLEAFVEELEIELNTT